MSSKRVYLKSTYISQKYTCYIFFCCDKINVDTHLQKQKRKDVFMSLKKLYRFV